MRISEETYITDYLMPCLKSFEEKGNTPEEFGSLLYWATLSIADCFKPFGRGIDRERKERRDNARKNIRELPFGEEVLLAEVHYLETGTYVV